MFYYIIYIIAIIINFAVSFFTIWNIRKYMREMQKNKQVIGTVLLIIISIVMLSMDVIEVLSASAIEVLSASAIYILGCTFFVDINFLIPSFTFLLAKKSGRKDINTFSIVSLVTSISGIFVMIILNIFGMNLSIINYWVLGIISIIGMSLPIINWVLGIIAIVIYKTTPKISSSTEISKPSSICPKCGSPVHGNKQFCTKCGQKINTI